MPLPSSPNPISLNAIHIEAGGSSASQASLNDSDIRGLIGKSSQAPNSFSEYYGAASTSPTATWIDRGVTGGNGFPNGWVTLSSGNKIVVAAMMLAGIDTTTANTYMNLGGTAMNLAVRLRTGLTAGPYDHFRWDVAIYYLETTASGSRSVQGNGGSGRSAWDIWEITDFGSSTPYTTDTASTTGGGNNTVGITVDSQYNGITLGVGMSFDGTITVTNQQTGNWANYESATHHRSWIDEGTASGNITYTYTNTTDTSNQPISLVTASWK